MKIGYKIIITCLAVLSILGCIFLFLCYIPLFKIYKIYISASSLIAIGFTALITLLLRMRHLTWVKIIKESVIGVAFILWGISLLITGTISIIMGDIVIVLFIIDLGHTCLECMWIKTQEENKSKDT